MARGRLESRRKLVAVLAAGRAPVLLPSIIGSMVLLFGTSFAAYATAYALTSGHIGLVPLKIGELISGNVLSDPTRHARSRSGW